MTYNIPDKNFTQSGIQSGDNGQFVIGADVIALLTPVKHPMIMVDKIVYYHSDPLTLIAERYVSANEPAFTGHFPNMKLWPGVYTLEGLRQTCYLLHVLHDLEQANLLKGVMELQKRQILRPQIDHELCQSVLDYLKVRKTPDPDLFSVSMKFLEPVFAGSLIKYHCMRDENRLHRWPVEAVVDEVVIARGMIVQSLSTGK
jgi:3-hydroxymyristoyl/3-hydroxydecanoyl-(acyl carrier protein) dehydratase